MRRLITTLAIIALTFSNSYATEVQPTSNTIETSILTRDQIAEVYEWNVTTNHRIYSGTSNTLAEAQKMIDLVATGEIILDRKIESYFQVKNENASTTMRLYFWEVTTNSGTAKGFSSSESQAKRMIELVATGSILTYKIVQSADFGN
jgi:hypothetical protein